MKQIIFSLSCLLATAAGYALGSYYYYYSPFYAATKRAIAVVYPTKGNTVTGVVNFVEQKDGLHISAKINGLTPGKHGFHVHEYGNCACDDAICAGGHFDPTHQPHGAPQNEKRHVGDWGNVLADSMGTATYELVDTQATLNGPHSIIGRAVIVHADPDDLTSQPSGNAGARVACGVIGIAKTEK